MLEPIPNSQQWERGPRIVAIGGGTGLSTMLRGLKNYTRNLTAVVTVADDGGGSGMLRRDMGMPPPGDIRHCMESLANVEPIMQRLLTYRFTEGALAGQSFGNLILAALNGVTGSFEEAVSQMSQVLAITGQVVPVTSADVQLEAIFENGASFFGSVSCARPLLISFSVIAASAGTATIKINRRIICVMSIVTLEPTKSRRVSGIRNGARTVSITINASVSALLPP